MGARHLVSLCFVGFVACSSNDPQTPQDAAATTDVVTVIDTPVATDARSDVAGDARADSGTAMLYSPCRVTSDCRGITQATCIDEAANGYPGGLCSRSCRNDTDCGASGACLAFNGGNVCFPRCTDSASCRMGYRCFLARSANASMGITEARTCFPFCGGDAQCTSTMRCNPWTNFCGTTDTARGDNGAPCTQGSDCRWRCNAPTDSMGAPTIYYGGTCYSRCEIPDDSEYQGATYPRAGCPTGSVCYRTTRQMAGDVGECRKECTASSDCRGGYICVRPTVGGMQQSNGYCAPMNCRFMTQTCPPEAECRTTATDDAGVPTNGFCVPRDGDGGVGDGGAVDAASDGSAGDGSVRDGSASDAGASADAATG